VNVEDVEMGKPERTSLVISAVRYALLFFFCANGVFCLLAMVQSASYSVTAQPLSEIYKTRAMLCLPISILLFSVGGLFFYLSPIAATDVNATSRFCVPGDGPIVSLTGKDGIARSIYVTATGLLVVIVRIFVKKTQKTAQRELELARQRAKEVE
jgi:hypothetical protein